MSNKGINEKAVWRRVKDMLGDRQMTLGRHWSYNLKNDPKRLAFVLSRYKFAAKVGSKDRSILELGCSEGMGVPILTEFAKSYRGVDSDVSAIEVATQNWSNDRISFMKDDFLGRVYGQFDTVVSLDVVEHIALSSEQRFFDTIYSNLKEDGIGIVGTPNIRARAYASPASKEGHLNMFDSSRLKTSMQGIFRNVFLFGINDEVVHTGYTEMAHYLVCIGCNKRSEYSL
ncbi:MAG: class I SAM-dependent methyltransferase [Candidatus Omnitrophota bacterium]